MRFLIVDTYYPAFLDAHYSARPSLADAPYDDQWRTLMSRCFGTSDAYSHFLGRLGHDAYEVVFNCQALQHAWAREQGIRLRKVRSTDPRILLAQAETLRPDVTYVQDLHALGPEDLQALRARSRILVGQIATEPPPETQLAHYDLLLTSFPHFVERFRKRGFATEHLRLGFDPRVLTQLGATERDLDVVFVGAIGASPRWRSNDLLQFAANRVPVDFWGYVTGQLPIDSAIRSRYHGEAWGLDMYRILARSKIVLNRHGDVAENYANNMRLYEATGAGSLVVTDAKRNLAELFEPGKEVVTYSTPDELVEMIVHYVDNESERATIAQAGHERTLRDHTYGSRMEELVAILGRYLA